MGRRYPHARVRRNLRYPWAFELLLPVAPLALSKADKTSIAFVVHSIDRIAHPTNDKVELRMEIAETEGQLTLRGEV